MLPSDIETWACFVLERRTCEAVFPMCDATQPQQWFRIGNLKPCELQTNSWPHIQSVTVCIKSSKREKPKCNPLIKVSRWRRSQYLQLRQTHNSSFFHPSYIRNLPAVLRVWTFIPFLNFSHSKFCFCYKTRKVFQERPFVQKGVTSPWFMTLLLCLNDHLKNAP